VHLSPHRARTPGTSPAGTLPPKHDAPQAPTGAGTVGALGRWLVRKALRLAGDPPLRVLLPGGEEVAPAGQPAFTVRVRDRRVLRRLLLNPDLGFGDAYSAGGLEIDGDLVSFLEMTFRSPRRDGLLQRLFRALTKPRRNSLAGSRDNIHRHYDLGNDFYRLWLDERLVYTCAYFPTPSATLEEAQLAKMDHVCRKLRLRPGQTVIEAGCGWGALALHMARHYGVTVRAFNISRQQVAYARQRARAEGLDHRVEFVEDDYRTITGTCDAFASVGMLEHVGPDHYRRLGAVIRRCLKPTGLGLIHSIGRNRPAPTNAWLERRIFPGSYMPSLRELLDVLEPWNFSVLDVENLRLHYALTLRHWLDRFEKAADRVRAMFDEPFVRTWRLYLASSVAGFSTGHVQLFQVVFAHGGSNQVPWTRADLYDGRPAGGLRGPG
jgi:cyclopropane-fatty-acyl-phospholipid synthase